MSVSMGGEYSVVGGEKKIVISLFRSLLPLPLAEHIFLLAISVVPPVLISRFGDYPGFDGVILVVIATIYLSLRIHLAQRRYKTAPTMEVSDREIVLPHSHTINGLERVLPARSVKSIEFFTGTGSLRKTVTSMVITDEHDQAFRMTGFTINLLRLREALEKHGWEYTQRRNPKRFVHLAFLAAAGAAAMYFYIQIV